jgi:hypothetical protein
MKKVALSLLAFTLVGALAVAQDAPSLKLSGYLNTGVKVTTNDGTTDTIYGDDAGNPWGRLDVNGSYGTATNGVEWSLRTADDATAPKINYAYAWSKFFSGLVTVKAGHVDDGTFTTAGDIGTDFTDANSILVFVTPVAGFNAGASWFLPLGGGSTPLGLALQASYTADKLVKVEGAVKVADSKATDLLLGVGVLAVDKLTLAADTSVAGLDDYAKTGAAKSDVNLGYALSDSLSVGLLTYVYTWGGDVKFIQADGKTAAPLGLSVKPSVSYTVDPVISIGANVKYAKGPQGNPDVTKDLAPLVSALLAATSQAQVDAALASYNVKGFGNDASFVEVNPSVTLTLSPAAKIITSVAYDSSLDDKKLAYAGKASQTTFKIDFRYNF